MGVKLDRCREQVRHDITVSKVEESDVVTWLGDFEMVTRSDEKLVKFWDYQYSKIMQRGNIEASRGV